MKLIIDIHEKDYQSILNSGQVPYGVVYAILIGTPLPKGHGRLIDANYLKDVILLHSFHGNDKNIVPYSDRKGYRLRDREVIGGIINAPTIIEADKEG